MLWLALDLRVRVVSICGLALWFFPISLNRALLCVASVSRVGAKSSTISRGRLCAQSAPGCGGCGGGSRRAKEPTRARTGNGERLF
jgi:hypothetical protein